MDDHGPNEKFVILQSVRHQNPNFSPTPSRRTADKKSGGSETKRGLRRISGVASNRDLHQGRNVAKMVGIEGALARPS